VQVLKISLITVTFNAEDTIKRCIESVLAQDYNHIEYIIVDGASTDNTLNIIAQYKHRTQIVISEPDSGIYDAMNKGIRAATGQIIGMLNADDVFAAPDVLSRVACAFATTETSIVYGNLNYMKPEGQIIRIWHAGSYRVGAFNFGWMPPHPTFYCHKRLFDEFGYYDTQYGTAADYELMLRFIHANGLWPYYLNRLMINMEVGGVSNKNFSNRLKAWKFDLKAMGKNGVLFPHLAIVLKPLRKIFQYMF